jgi:hypothetical protein
MYKWIESRMSGTKQRVCREEFVRHNYMFFLFSWSFGVKQWAQSYKAGWGVCVGPAVLVCFTESSGRIALYRAEFTSVTKSWTFSLAKLKIITILQCPDSSRQIFRTTKERQREVLFLSGHPDMQLPATVRLFLVMEPFVQPLIASPEGFRKAQWPGRSLKLRVWPLSGPCESSIKASAEGCLYPLLPFHIVFCINVQPFWATETLKTRQSCYLYRPYISDKWAHGKQPTSRIFLSNSKCECRHHRSIIDCLINVERRI